jgi:hypothetical protein
MAKDLLRTISALQYTAIGNCRKRIEAAAQRAKGILGDSTDADAPGPDRNPPCGVTSVLKRKHGL